MPSISVFRLKYPELNDISDDDILALADKHGVDVWADPVEEETPTTKEVVDENPNRSFGDAAKDVGVALAKGAVTVPQSAIGLLDVGSAIGSEALNLGTNNLTNLETTGAIGKSVDEGMTALGIPTFSEMQNKLEASYSPQQQAANQAVRDAQGVGGTLSALAENPSAAVGAALESVPSMFAGGLAGRGVGLLTGVESGLARGAIGEGVVTAGQQADQMRQDNPDKKLHLGEAVAALGTGAVTGVVNALSGHVADKIGLDDINRIGTGGHAADDAVTPVKNWAGRVAGTTFMEGAEEALQSTNETIGSNIAEGRDPLEGVGNAATMGAVTGGLMGGGISMVKPANKPTTAINLDSILQEARQQAGVSTVVPGDAMTNVAASVTQFSDHLASTELNVTPGNDLLNRVAEATTTEGNTDETAIPNIEALTHIDPGLHVPDLPDVNMGSDNTATTNRLQTVGVTNDNTLGVIDESIPTPSIESNELNIPVEQPTDTATEQPISTPKVDEPSTSDSIEVPTPVAEEVPTRDDTVVETPTSESDQSKSEPTASEPTVTLPDTTYQTRMEAKKAIIDNGGEYLVSHEIVPAPEGKGFVTKPIEVTNEQPSETSTVPTEQTSSNPSASTNVTTQESTVTNQSPKQEKKRLLTNTVQPTDSILQAIAKYGGISRVQAEQEGFDPAYFEQRGHGIMRVFSNSPNAKTVDDMHTLLSQHGYPIKDTNELLDAVDRSLRGESVYTPKGSEHMAEIAAQENIDSQQAQEVWRYENVMDQLKQHDAENGTQYHEFFSKQKDVTPEALDMMEQLVHDNLYRQTANETPTTAPSETIPTIGTTGENQVELGNSTTTPPIQAEQQIAEDPELSAELPELPTSEAPDLPDVVDRSPSEQPDLYPDIPFTVNNQSRVTTTSSPSEQPDIPFSQAPSKVTNPHTASTIKQALVNQYGSGFAGKLLRKGRLNITTPEEAVKLAGEKARTAKGFYHGETGVTHIIPSNIEQSHNLHGLLLHEIGVHAGQLSQTKMSFKAALSTLRQLHTTNDPQVVAAYKAVPIDTPPHLVDEEAMGYLVEHAPKLSVAQWVIAVVKNALRNLGLPQSKLTKFSKTDIIHLAHVALKSGKVNTSNDGTKFSMPRPEFLQEDEPVRDLTAMANVMRTGEMPVRHLTMQDFNDKVVTAFADATRPFQVWTRILPDKLKAQQLIDAMDLAVERKKAFEGKAMSMFGRDIGKAVRAIANHTGWRYDAAKEMAGHWMSAKYSMEANKNLGKRYTTEATEARTAMTDANDAYKQAQADKNTELNKVMGNFTAARDASEKAIAEVQRTTVARTKATAKYKQALPKDINIHDELSAFDDAEIAMNDAQDKVEQARIQRDKELADNRITNKDNKTAKYKEEGRLREQWRNEIKSLNKDVKLATAEFEKAYGKLNTFVARSTGNTTSIVAAQKALQQAIDDHKSALDTQASAMRTREDAKVTVAKVRDAETEKVEAAKKELQSAINDFNKKFDKYKVFFSTLNDPSIVDPTQSKHEAGLAGGYNTATAKALMAQIESHIPVDMLEAVANPVYKMNEWKLRQDIKNGKVSQQVADKFDKSGLYVPLTGDPRYDPTDGSGFEGGSLNQTEDKRLEGRTTSLAQNGIDASFEQLGKSARYNGWVNFKDKLAEIYDGILADYQAQGMSEKEAVAKISEVYQIDRQTHRDPFTRSSDDVIIRTKAVGDKLETQMFSINNKAAMDALRSLNTEEKSWIANTIGVLTRFKAMGLVRYAPLFPPVNMVLDTFERLVNLRNRVIPGYEHLDMKAVSKEFGMQMSGMFIAPKQGIGAVFTVAAQNSPLKDSVSSRMSDPAVQEIYEFLDAGGSSTWGGYMARNGKALADSLGKTSTKLHNMNELIDVYNNTLDMMPGIATYKALRHYGVDIDTAAAFSLGLFNFSKKGTRTTNARSFYMFFQPAVQSTHQMLQTLATPGGKADLVTKMIIYYAIYSMVRAGYDDDELDDNKVDLSGNAMLSGNIPIVMQDGYILKIRMPYGIDKLAWGVAVNMVKFTQGKQTAMETVIELSSNVIKQAFPVAPSDTPIADHPFVWLFQTIVPDAFEGGLNVGMDVNSFGNQLTKSFVDKNAPRSEQGKRTTAEFYKVAAKSLAKVGIDIFPEQVRELMNAYMPLPAILDTVKKEYVDNPNKIERGQPTITPMLSRFILPMDSDVYKDRSFYRFTEKAESIRRYAAIHGMDSLNDKEKEIYKIGVQLEKRIGEVRGKASAAAAATRQHKLGKAAVLTKQSERLQEKTRDWLIQAMPKSEPLF